MPVVLLSATEYAKILFEGLVGAFAGSVHLRVIGRADVLVDVQDMAKFRRELGYKADITVRDYLVRYAVVRDDIVQVE